MIDTNVNQAITEENIVTRILKYYLKYVSYVTVISNQRQTKNVSDRPHPETKRGMAD